jgi:hypothetical protein
MLPQLRHSVIERLDALDLEIITPSHQAQK